MGETAGIWTARNVCTVVVAKPPDKTTWET
jgi:hypothetical protein